MGYTTTFDGTFNLNKRLFDTEVLYLLEFSRTRRMKRDVAILQNVPDPAREAVGLPLGEDGCYFVNEKWDKDSEISVVDYNRPPAGQPGLWCQWIPTSDGGGIQWDGGEKFYTYVEWLQYIISNFLDPWGYMLNGKVNWQGEDAGDTGRIIVENNRIVSPEGAEQLLEEAVSPVPVPLAVWEGLEAVQAAGTHQAYYWHRVMDEATALGYHETATWIQSNLEKYLAGLELGFEADGKVLDCRKVL